MQELSADILNVQEYSGYCCAAKQYWSNKQTILNLLEVFPRVIICKKCLKVGESYEQNIWIKNRGIYPRCMSFDTDSPSDTTVQASNLMSNYYLKPNQEMCITVCVTPTQKKDVQGRRNIFINFGHPKFTLEVPIIVLKKFIDPSLPASIEFPRSAPTTRTYYEFIIYNPTSEALKMSIRSKGKYLEVVSQGSIIKPKDYLTILLILCVATNLSVSGTLKLKIGNLDVMRINYVHEPENNGVNLNLGDLYFDDLKFGYEAYKEVIMCNESSNPISYKTIIEKVFIQQSITEIRNEDDIDWSNDVLKNLKSFSKKKSITFESDDDSHKDRLQKSIENICTESEHFTISPKEGSLKAFGSYKLSVSFRPIINEDCSFDDSKDPPFPVSEKIIFNIFNDSYEEQKAIVVIGHIIGPQVDIAPKVIDFRKIFVGEEHCEQIRILNIESSLPAHVLFKGHTPPTLTSVSLTPAEELTLLPGELGMYTVSFFARNPGKFVTKLHFKVKNGGSYYITIRGHANGVRLKIFPEILELGNIPFAIPQRRYVLLMNPLSVPITVQSVPTENGEETPLILNVRQCEYPLPITVKDPIEYYASQQLLESCQQTDEEFYANMEWSSNPPSEITFKSLEVSSSWSSYEFGDEILDIIPAYAKEIVRNMQKQKFYDKIEVEKRIIAEAVSFVLNTNYFYDLSFNGNFARMDWNAVPPDPKEVYCDNEIIYLKPNSGKDITVILVPNTLGYINRSITMRACPEYEPQEHEPLILVDSEVMTGKLWMEYTVRVPELVWEDFIEFDECYAGETYNFTMSFDNVANICGFFFYDVVPNCIHGEMFFPFNCSWKFFIEAESAVDVDCSVIFKKMGLIQLSGLIKIVGETIGRPYHISSTVLPQRIRVCQSQVFCEQMVLEKKCIHFCLENITPTRTWIKIYLKNDRHQDVYPKGAILSRHGQGLYITITSMFSDPGTYKNVLYLQCQYGDLTEVPLTCIVNGMPVFFDPSLETGINAGPVITSANECYYKNIPGFEQVINIKNFGERYYFLKLKMIKSSLETCKTEKSPGRIFLTPKSLLIHPKSEGILYLTASAYDKTTIWNEFRLTLVDQSYRQRFLSKTFAVTVTFVHPEVHWRCNDICIEIMKTQLLLENCFDESICLINATNVPIEDVHLKVFGPFQIKPKEENVSAVDTINFFMFALEHKEFEVVLNTSPYEEMHCRTIEGRVMVFANCRPQKSLYLKVKMLTPELTLPQSEVVIFSKQIGSDVIIDIENPGCVKAYFKWKKLSETIQFIEKHEDPQDIVHDVLSEILCNLEIEDDTIDAMDILNKIIERLDISTESKEASEDLIVNRTISSILDALLLKDSQIETRADICLQERQIYFYEKHGVVNEKETKTCMLHIPGMKKGYIVKAAYNLEVEGGKTKEFNITLISLGKIVELSSSNIYIGIKPWYEPYKVFINIKNVTKYNINVRLRILPIASRQCRHIRFADGYAYITNEKCFDMPPFGVHKIEIEGIMGFSKEYVRNMEIVINNSEVLLTKLRGQGVMPIILLTSKLQNERQNSEEIKQEYYYLQRIFYFDEFKSIIEMQDEEDGKAEEEEIDEEMSATVCTASSSGSTIRCRDIKFFKLMKTYVHVNNDARVPNGSLLVQHIETEKFLDELYCSKTTRTIVDHLHDNYLKTQSVSQFHCPLNLKFFAVQSLPFERHGYILNMHDLKLNKFQRFELHTVFLGPGWLIAAVRSKINIPGLIVTLEVEESRESKFYYYNSERKTKDIHNKVYQNMHERKCDINENNMSKLKDVKRSTAKKESKEIKCFYNSVNESAYLRRKQHFTLCKVACNSTDTSNLKIRIVILMKPTSNYFKADQIIEDYIYIDLHMGPTIPIKILGRIRK